MSLASVEQLHKTSSKYDVMYNGSLIRLRIKPCECGVAAAWVTERKLSETIPIISMYRGSDSDSLNQKIEVVLDEWHFHPTWFEKYILRVKLEDALRKWVKKSHTKYLKLKESEEFAASVMDRL